MCICISNLIIYIVLCEGAYIKNICILDVDDKNRMCVFAYESTHAAYLNLNFQQHQSIKFSQLLHLKNKVILDKVPLDTIN